MSHASRPYAGVDDLRRMQDAVARAYLTTDLRVGDLAWLTRQHTHRELSLDIRLWESDDGQLVGWTFFRSNGEFNLFVTPGHADLTLLDEMLTVIAEAARQSAAAGDAAVSLSTYGVDPARSDEDRALAAALRRHGFTVVSETGGVMMRDLDHLPEIVVPRGYRLAAVQTPAHVRGRVTAQQAAFAPSKLTWEHYERVRRTWPYRAELDRIVLTDDDVVVAFCTAWLDEENTAGLLEPVGTHPTHQRRGLGRAVCADALRALRDAGARTAQVVYASDAAGALYRAIGFQRVGDEIVFCRDAIRHE